MPTREGILKLGVSVMSNASNIMLATKDKIWMVWYYTYSGR